MIDCPNTEKSVMCILLTEPEYFRTVRDFGIQSEDFNSPLLRKLYAYLCENPSYEFSAVLDAFPSNDEEIVALINVAPSGVRMPEWCRTLKEYSARRKMAAEAERLLKLAESPGSDFRNELGKILKTGGDQLARIDGMEGRTMAEVIENYTAQMDDQSLSDEVIPYGLPLDNFLHHERKEIVTLGAVPGCGKTNFALSVFLNLLKMKRTPALFVQEMKTVQLLQRLTANGANIRLSDVMARREREKCREAEAALKKLAEANRFLLRGAGDYRHSATGISNELRRFREESGGIDFVAVDYLQVLTPPPHLLKSDDSRKVIDYNLEALKEIAREFNTPILLLSQLSRAGQNGAPKLTSLKESAHIEEISSAVLFLKRKNEKPNIRDDAPEEITVLCPKNRNGRQFQIDLLMYGAYCRFSEHRYTGKDCCHE